MMLSKKRGKNEDIDNYAQEIVLGERKKILIPKIIWLFWDGEMPLIVHDCLEEVKSLHPDYEVHILNNKNLIQFCDIDFTKFNNITYQQKADLIRLSLLYKYGGYWLDASIMLYEKIDWIGELMQKNGSEGFAFYRAKNTLIKEFPVLENWLLASTQGNIFYKIWFEELKKAILMSPKLYIQQIRVNYPDYKDYFQRISNLEYLVAYVACQKIMRETKVDFTLIDCDKNAFYYQVEAKWLKQKILVHFATNHKPTKMPKLIKLAGKERKYLNKYYKRKKYMKESLLDFRVKI